MALKAPKNLQITFKPSPRQYELWKLLQPDYCPHCGGHIKHVQIGTDMNGNPQFKPQCDKCGSFDLPQLILGGGAAGGGKGQLLDAEIITPFGTRRFGDLKVGDTITSATTGGITEVIALHPIETRDYYRVHFVDGTYVDCSDNHIWRGHFSRKKSKKAKKYPEYFAEYGDDELILAHQLYEWHQKKKSGMYDGVHFIIPLCKPVRFTISTQQYVHPYIAGAMIGDGCMSSAYIKRGQCGLTTMDPEIIDRCIELGASFDKEVYRESGRAKTYTIYDKNFIDSLIKSELAGHTALDKFIPRRYKLGSIEERISLMQGLMDTDGYIDERGHLSYCTISKQLAEDVAFVIRSLGGVATISKKAKTGYRNEQGDFIETNDAYNVFFRIENAPDLVYVPRKKERARYGFNGGNSELGKRVLDVEYIGKKEGRCITVKEPSGLYITNDFTVTHNSYVSSCWLVSSCMRFPDLRAVVARKTIKSLRESTFNTIKAVMKQWGLKEGENYKINNLEGVVTFWNDSTITLKELEDLPSDSNFERLGSSEFTIAAVDEVSEISEKAIEVLFSRLRWKTHETFKTPRLLMTTNPTINWVRGRFVQDSDGNPIVCKEGEAYVPFSVFDNPDIAFRQIYEAALNKITDPATKARLLYGNWDYVDSNDAAAYWNFKGDVHLVDSLKEKVYDPLKPIVISLDFNVAPFMSALAFQVDYENKKLYILEEFTGKPEDKENNTPKFAQKISNYYLTKSHLGGLLVTGDPAGAARSTQTEEGINNYTIFLSHLHPSLRATTKLMPKQPPHKTRLEFINNLFNEMDGWEIQIDMRCRRLTEDFIYQKKNEDGTKNKAKVTDPKLGLKYEKYGHMSDAFDYGVCLLLSSQWKKFQQASSGGIATVNTPIYGTFDY